MERFAELLEALTYTPSRNRKIALLSGYFNATSDPDRGYALATLTSRMVFPSVKPSLYKSLISQRMDPVLFDLSYDFVGDLAETISLCWPFSGQSEDIRLGALVDMLGSASRSDAPAIMADLMDRFSPSSRYALIKMTTGGMRAGVSSGLVRQALAKLSGKTEEEIEDVWQAGDAPYTELFRWLDGNGTKPGTGTAPRWRSFMLANPLAFDDAAKLNPDDYRAEWKWDGIRVQALSDGERTWLYSRTGEDITSTFPDLVLPRGFAGSLDGELLARRNDAQGLAPGTFNDLQQRLNRKSPVPKLMESHPVFLRAYDLLFQNGEDLRTQPTLKRRDRLSEVLLTLKFANVDLSEAFSFTDFHYLDRLRQSPPDPAIEGIMLKRKDARYIAGRPAGLWHKWKKAPLTADVVLMYAQRGHGKRSGLYSDFTFGAWSDDGAVLLPVGKAYFGFTDEELTGIDRFVRANTIDRFGPVRSVRAEPEHGMVFEIEFDGIGYSPRHKSGIALRFPRVSRLRFDKLPKDADSVTDFRKLIDPN